MWYSLFLSLKTTYTLKPKGLFCLQSWNRCNIIFNHWLLFRVYWFCFYWITLSDVLQKVQHVRTDSTTKELGVNTDADWESQVAAMLEYSSSLMELYDSLRRKQEEDEETREKGKQQLQKKKEEATRQHQVSLTHTHTHTCALKGTLQHFWTYCDCASRLFWTNWSLWEWNCSWTTPRPPGRTS